MRQRNNKFASDVRAGKKAAHPSRQEKLAQRSPLNLWALGLVVFVVMGGGTYTTLKKVMANFTDICGSHI
jgi:hypothetical protein